MVQLVDATGIGLIQFAVVRVTQRAACAPFTSQHIVYCRLCRLEKFFAGLQVQRLQSSPQSHYNTINVHHGDAPASCSVADR
jgi:hypothetical protein